MDRLIWQKKYETGVDVVDYQHQKIVDMINNLIHASTISKEAAKLVTQVTLEQLSQYIKFHFETEEDLMREMKYPQYEEHKNQHDVFKNSIFSLVKRNENEVVTESLINFLTNWLFEHIAQSDQKYVPFIKSNTTSSLKKNSA